MSRRPFAMVTLVALAVVALVIAGAAGASKNGPPLITVEGSTYTNTTDGQVTTRVSMAAKEARNGTVSGTFSERSYYIAQDGTLTPFVTNNVNVACLSAEKSTGTVWFSGVVTSGSDQRWPSELQTQIQQVIGDGKAILIGRFRDANADGIVDHRSLTVVHATSGYPNALLSSGDDGTVSPSWFITGNATSAASACLLRNSDYIVADYKVINGRANEVQWLKTDFVTTVGLPFQGTAAALSSPPAASVYNVSSFTEKVLSPRMHLTIACTAAEKAKRAKALAADKRQMAAARRAYFRTHHNAKARAAFVKRQQAKLKALQQRLRACA